jgi:hypothetical protein
MLITAPGILTHEEFEKKTMDAKYSYLNLE